MQVTTAYDAVQLFAVTTEARRAHRRWVEDPHRGEVVALVSAHRTSVVYDLSPTDILDTCRSTEHPLGNIRKSQVDKIPEAADWNPPFAFMHVLHHHLEQLRRPFTWTEFKNYLFLAPEGHALLGTAISEQIRTIIRDHPGIDEQRVKDAMQWRLGLAYYSFLRELYTTTALRARGVDLRVHPLADALFRVDAWADRTVVNLWMDNKRYRARGQTGGVAGRKRTSAALLADANPPFSFQDLALKPATTYGTVLLPEPLHLDRAAKALTTRTTDLVGTRASE